MSTEVTILFVDDEVSAREAFRRTLLSAGKDWSAQYAGNLEEAIYSLQSIQIDLVVTDVHMPESDGFALLEQMRNLPRARDIPVVMITGDCNGDFKHQAIRLGATDLLVKPVRPEELLARIQSCLESREQERHRALYRQSLEHLLTERTQQVEALKLEVIWRLAKLIEYRDEYTGNHVIRVGCYAKCLARALGESSDFGSLILQSAPLHDLGKIAMPDSLLLKPGPLTAEERQMMETHCRLGADMLRQDCKLRFISARLTARSEPFLNDVAHPGLEMAARICLSHHERWDGTGYPARLRGEEIPLEGRIVALCDVYDALRSKRPYKPSLDEEVVVSILREGSGTHFDEQIVNAFEDVKSEFAEIWFELGDDPIDATQHSETSDAIALC